MFDDFNSRTNLTLSASITAALIVGGGLVFVLMRQPQVAVPPVTTSQAVQAAQRIEDVANGRTVFTSQWMTLQGYKCDQGQRVEWRIQASVPAKDAEIVLSFRSTTPSGTCWESEVNNPIIIVGHDRRVDLPCKRSEQRSPREVVTLIECSGGMEAALAIATAANPKLLFGQSVCELGPQGALAASELVERAGMVQQTRRGRTEAEAKDDVKTWLGDVSP